MLRDYLKYGKTEFWRRQKMGCIGGLIGLPLLCCFVFIPLYLVNENDLSAGYLLVPLLLLALILSGGGVLAVVLMVRRQRQDDSSKNERPPNA